MSKYIVYTLILRASSLLKELTQLSLPNRRDAIAQLRSLLDEIEREDSKSA